MDRTYYDRWADNDYEQVIVEGELSNTPIKNVHLQLPESCRLGPTDGPKSSFSASRSFENTEQQEATSEPEMNRYYGLTEVDSSLQDAINRMGCVGNMLSKITLTNKSAEFCQLLEDFLHNIEGMRLKLQAILSPFANLEQFSMDPLPITDMDCSTESVSASTITSVASDNALEDEQT
uniref:Uncharacterized protein n=1 Tax=Setaria digitata TaxID=48799 RepID=A0A915PRU5_9BILA